MHVPLFLTLRIPPCPMHQVGVSATPEPALEPLSQGSADTLNSMDGGCQLKSNPALKRYLDSNREESDLPKSPRSQGKRLEELWERRAFISEQLEVQDQHWLPAPIPKMCNLLTWRNCCVCYWSLWVLSNLFVIGPKHYFRLYRILSSCNLLGKINTWFYSSHFLEITTGIISQLLLH